MTIGDLQLVARSSHLACWAASAPVIVRELDDWQTLRFGLITVHHVYLSPHTGMGRRCRLEELAQQTVPGQTANTLVIGDFNLAPTPEDGLYGEAPSRFTSSAERTAFHYLLNRGFVDTTASRAGIEYTFERTVRGKQSRFRCDLALATPDLSAAVLYDHNTRCGPDAFTDHSGVIITFTNRLR